MSDKPKDTTVDVFEFANRIDAVKSELSVELFFFNKNYTPYATQISDVLQTEIKKLFLFDIIGDVSLGAGTGLVVRDLEYIEHIKKNDNVLLHQSLKEVGRAETLIHLIENERDDIVYFDETEHEFKRIKGIVARFVNGKESFYIFKMVEASKVVSGATAWQLDSGLVNTLQEEVAFKIPVDNQVLITAGDIFIFNQAKFEKLFNYDFVKLQQADIKAKDLLKKFRISVPSDIEGGIENILRESNALLNKFLKVDLDLVEHDKVPEIADEMQLEIMTDDEGAIIIMDKSDLSIFLDIISDNYYKSPTGHHYIAKSKKPIEVAEDGNER